MSLSKEIVNQKNNNLLKKTSYLSIKKDILKVLYNCNKRFESRLIYLANICAFCTKKQYQNIPLKAKKVIV